MYNYIDFIAFRSIRSAQASGLSNGPIKTDRNVRQ